ncbi:MAG: ABC transporter permease [Chloroflexi bacterium]|nr:MAG: ABC transporter permease [Chloroflexota bacterium]
MSAAVAAKPTSRQSESPWQQARRRFFAGRQGPVGLAILIVVVGFAIIGSLLLKYDFYELPQPDQFVYLGRGPSFAHPFGETARTQRDVLTLVVNGARGSLIIGFVSAIGSLSIGTIMGLLSGYFGGKIDSLIMRVTDVFLAIPSLFVIIFASRMLIELGGSGLISVILVFIVFGWMGTARLVRGQVIAIRNFEYVEAARALGVRPLRIAMRHVLPNAIGPVVVSAPFAVGGAIIGEAFISYLGYGVSPIDPTWGNMLSDSQPFLLQGNWWWIFFPALFIIATSLSVNMIGDALRDSLEPEGRKG